MARTSKAETKLAAEEVKQEGIDNHGDFNEALLEAQAGVADNPNPYLEVSPRFFSALSKGRVANSMTYGDPGVRIFKHGEADEVLSEERMSAEKHREVVIRRISEKANK